MNNTFIQFELWKDCKIGCKFCCNKGQQSVNKIDSLKFVINYLEEDNDINSFNEIGFIGGEFFNGELEDKETKELFYKLFEILSTKSFKKIYIMTSLIFDLNLYFNEFILYLKQLNLIDKVLICTSYDLKYRFHTQEREQLWRDNMKYCINQYPLLRLHVEIILTQFFIDAVLSNEFSITDFQNEFHCGIDYMEPSSGLFYTDKKECASDLPGFFPTKKSYIKFLKKVAIDNKEIDLNTFLSMDVRADKMFYIDGGKHQMFENRRTSGEWNKPLDTTKKYELGLIDSDITMTDVVKTLREIY